MSQTRRSCQLRLSPEQMMAQARAITGIDMIDEEALQPFKVLHASYNHDACLHEAGVAAIEHKLLRLLCNRLRMKRDIAAHPEILQIPILSPVVICGLPRSGTTKTQKLLAATGDFHYLSFWQTYNPSLITGARSESPQVRIEEADAFIRWFDRVAPDAKLAHAFGAVEPEEDTLLLEYSLLTGAFIAFSTMTSYLEWVATQSLIRTFEYFRDMLKYLQWQMGAHKPWVLKCPLYYGHEPTILSVFPDARLICTHRDPNRTVPSLFRLLTIVHAPFSERPPQYESIMPMFADALEAHFSFRRSRPDVCLLDLHYDEITGSGVDLTKKIYQFCDMPLRHEALERVRRWEETNPVHKLGAFTYDVRDYQLTSELIRARFASYLEFLETASSRQ